MSTSAYQKRLLAIIYDAHDRVKDIPDDQWHANEGYYSTQWNSSDLFGHYVRSLGPYRDIAPERIRYRNYIEAASPLANALNVMLDHVLQKNIYDCYQICKGNHPSFQQKGPKARAIAAFVLIEEKFPRHPKSAQLDLMTDVTEGEAPDGTGKSIFKKILHSMADKDEA